MSEISVIPPPEGTAQRPGGVLELSFEWSLAQPPKTLEARLFWFTRGKGEEDVSIVDAQPAQLEARGKRRFKFKLPDAPYSFSGLLISLVWAVELVADDESARWEFVLGPDGKEVLLDQPGRKYDLPQQSDHAARIR